MGGTVVNSVISLFLIMLVGVYAQRKGIINSEINKGINNILVNISLPMLILSSFMTNFEDGMIGQVYSAFFYSFIALFIVFIASQIVAFPIKGPRKSVIKFANIFTNTGFLGMPLLDAIYGPEGVIYGAAFSLFFNLLLFTYGLTLYKGLGKGNQIRKQILDIFKNPVIIAIFLGVIIMFMSIDLPIALENSAKIIGSMTSPLSMISIGCIFARVRFREYLKDWTIYYSIISKLIIMPFLIIVFFNIVDFTGNVANSIVIQMALPTATLGSIFAERFENQAEYTTIIIVATTLVSMITIPIMVGILS